jgi:hypothetical protein
MGGEWGLPGARNLVLPWLSVKSVCALKAPTLSARAYGMHRRQLVASSGEGSTYVKAVAMSGRRFLFGARVGERQQSKAGAGNPVACQTGLAMPSNWSCGG